MNFLVWAIGVVCVVWVIYDILSNQRGMSGGKKVLWIILALLFSVITAIVYYLVEKR